MAEHAILRFAKHKAGPAGGIEAHHERTKKGYGSNPDIDISRSKDNIHLVTPTTSYRREIDRRIKASGCRTRKDSTMFVDTLVTASPTFFEGRSQEDIRLYFTEAVTFLEGRIGQGNIFSAAIHLDEKTPHLHLCFTPITEDGRLSAKEILGNRAQLSKWQDQFHAHMNKQFPSLERGESSLVTRRRHIPTWLFKQSVNLTHQQQAIEKALAEITPFNAIKKRQEILAQLNKFFPKLESHMKQMKKYKDSIDYLTQENTSLHKEVSEGKSVLKVLEVAQMKQEYEALQAFVDGIPKEMLEALQPDKLLHTAQNRD